MSDREQDSTGEGPDSDDDVGEIRQGDSGKGLPGSVPPSSFPKRFRAATDAELDPQSFMVADDRAVARTTLRGGSIAKDRGDARFIGDAIQRLASTLREMAELFRAGEGSVSNPVLRNVVFGQSVTLELEVGFNEAVHVEFGGTRHSPTIDAARTVHELLAADPQTLLRRAVELGPNASTAFKSFLNVLAKDDVVLEWQGPEPDEIVVLTSEEARRDVAVLSQPGERVSERVVVPGTLTMADSELHQFKLTLRHEVDRPPLLKNKHRVHGTYAPELGPKLKDEGLWDSVVTATIDVSYDRPGTTAVPGERTYVLIDAEPLMSPATLFETT